LSGLIVRQSQYKSGQICRNVNQENAMNHGPVNFLDLMRLFYQSQSHLVNNRNKVETERENLSIEDEVRLVKPAKKHVT
jgi:hypothetical protein